MYGLTLCDDSEAIAKSYKKRQSQFSRANAWYQTRPAYSNIISRSLSGLKDTAKQRSSLTEPLLFSPGSLPKKRRGSKCVETPHIVVSSKSYSGQNSTNQASSHSTTILIPSRPHDKRTDILTLLFILIFPEILEKETYY